MERKCALVTGSVRGIGAASAVRLAKDGFLVVVNCRNESRMEAGNRIVKLCREAGSDAVCIAADVSDSAQCEKLVQAAVGFGGRLDVLVNNASIIRWTAMTKVSDAEFHETMLNNTYSTFYMMRAAVPVMKKQRSGRIINISSVGGIYGSPGAVAYGAAKGAVIAMTKSAAKELAVSNITVNSVAPGGTRTDMGSDILQCEARVKEQLRYVAMRRLAEPDEIAGAVSFLASDDASFVTGHILEVSGGVRM